MNPDYTSDIRHIERFIFDHNLYILTMFEKKLLSFNNSLAWENKESRKYNKQSNLHPQSFIDCDNFLQDPVKNLARDLTKPIWNCVMKVEPRVVYRKESEMESIGLINLTSKVLGDFFVRFKNEHEDQSNLKIELKGFQFDKVVESYGRQQQNQAVNWTKKTLQQQTKQLFKLFLAAIGKQLQSVMSTQQSQRSETSEMSEQNLNHNGTQHKLLPSYLACFKFMLLSYTQKDDDDIYGGELDLHTKLVQETLNDIIMCRIGSAVMCPMPQLMVLPLFLHPMLIALYGFLKLQTLELGKKDKQKEKDKDNKQIGNVFNLNMGLGSQEKPKDGTSKIIFDEIHRIQSASRVVFLNLDGYDSEFNIDLAKHLSKALMYISFPRQTNNRYENPEQINLSALQELRSYRLLRKYYKGDISQAQHEQLQSIFKLPEKEHSKNLYIFPIHSRNLSSTCSLPSINCFQTAFISFIMNQHMYSQILEFNPSVIVISYSQKLTIQKQFFVEMIKELTVIGNYKLVFYANISKSYMFSENYKEQLLTDDFKNLQEQFYRSNQQGINLINSDQMSVNSSYPTVNTDLLEKLSIFMKISSGTFSLQRTSQLDSYIQKYKNYKVLCYAGPLISRLSAFNQNLNRLKLRMNQYTSIIKVMDHYFNNRTEGFDKVFNKVISKFYIGLYAYAEKAIFADKIESKSSQNNSNAYMIMEQKMAEQSLSEFDIKRKQKSQKQIDEIKRKIWKKYSYSVRKSNFVSFRFQLRVEVSTQKIESKFFAYLPRYQAFTKNSRSQSTTPREAQNLLCLQFFTVLPKQSSHQPSSASYSQSATEYEKTQIQIVPNITQIHYSQTRLNRTSLIYMMNNLFKNSTQFCHLFGLIGEEFDYKVSPKVQMYPVVFKGGPVLNCFESFVMFSYFQAKDYVFMFWPKIYDHRKEILLRYLNEKYEPQPTSLFYCAKRNSPGVFSLIQTSHPHIIPRTSCKSICPIASNNTIYIFGGFYASQNNHLLFQTDITKLKYETKSLDELPRVVELLNIPKQFYFSFQEHQEKPENKVITKLKNDMIRPKIQYQFIEGEQGRSEEMGMEEDGKKKIVYMVGGVGEKFVRPCSMIGYIGYKLTFDAASELISTKRIQLHNIIPVNIQNPIRSMGTKEQKILTYAQNREISLITGQSIPGYYSISHNKITFNPENQRFEYKNQYQFCDPELRYYKDQISVLKRIIVDQKYRVGISAKSSRGSRYYTNFVTIALEDQFRYIVELQLMLSLDVRHMYPQLPSAVRLTGSSILAIDINIGLIYAVIKHPIYTLDTPVLAYFDLNQIVSRLKQSRPLQIQLKQLHKFQQNVTNNILITANSTTILLLHGQKFYNHKDVWVPEYLLRRNKKKYIKLDKIYGNQFYCLTGSSKSNSKSVIEDSLSPQLFYKYQDVQIASGISASLFLNLNNGTIYCFSFKTVERRQEYESVIFMQQSLDLSNIEKQDRLAWKIEKVYQYQFCLQFQLQGHQKKNQPLRLVQIIPYKQKDQSAMLMNMNMNRKQHIYELIGFYRDQCISGLIDTQANTKNIKVVFNFIGKSVNEYYKEMSLNVDKQYSVLLEKCYEDYWEMCKDGDKHNTLMG